MIRRPGLLSIAALLVVALTTPQIRAQEPGVVIFAAASLKNAMDEASASYVKETGKPAPRISYAASNTLVKQIEQGAPADLFISADLEWMDYAGRQNLIRAETRDNLFGNRLVLIAPMESDVTVSMTLGLQLGPILRGGRLAMGNVAAVPAGKYGKSALEKLGAWEAIKSQIAQADSVRAALLYVARGESPLGIVYQTDAAADSSVKVVGVFPEDTHPPIIYPIAVTKTSTHPDAPGFLAHLRGASTRAAFTRQGFAILPQKAPGN